MQTLDAKTEAVASVLWLLEAHYAMVSQGRVGSCIHYTREGEPPRWRPPIVEDFEGWPVNAVCAWLGYQRKLSKRYRLWPVGLALQKLEKHRPDQAAAVWARYVEIPPPNWYQGLDELAREGLRFIAKDIPGDVPEWGGRPPQSMSEQVRELLGDGETPAVIARRVGCSPRYVRRLRAALLTRPQQTASAVS